MTDHRLQAGPAQAGEGLAGLDAANVPEQISDMFRVVLVLIAAEHHVGVLAGLGEVIDSVQLVVEFTDLFSDVPHLHL